MNFKSSAVVQTDRISKPRRRSRRRRKAAGALALLVLVAFACAANAAGAACAARAAALPIYASASEVRGPLPAAESPMAAYEDSSGELYVGFRHNEKFFYVMPFSSYYDAYSAEERINGAEVAYCFNENLKIPHSTSDGTFAVPGNGPVVSGYYSFYTRIANPSGQQFAELAENEQLQGEALRKKIISIGLNGYPHNYSGYFSEGGAVSENNYRVLTQWAIWYYTDGSDYSSRIQNYPEMLQLLQRLIASDLPDEVVDGVEFAHLYDFDSVMYYDYGTQQWTQADYVWDDRNQMWQAVTPQQCLLSVGRAGGVQPTEVSLKVRKLVTGDGGEQNRDFRFTLNLVDGGANPLSGEYRAFRDGVPETVSLDSDGNAAFTLKHGESIEITGLPIGTYFKIAETEANQDGYTTSVDTNLPSGEQDDEVGGANNWASDSGAEAGEISVTFTNHRDAPASYHAEVKAHKTLGGGLPQDGQFTFILSDSLGQEVSRRNGADGSVTFSLDLPAPGTYEYTLRELNDGQGGITYDERVRAIRVVVKPPAASGGAPEIEVFCDGEPHDAQFQNLYGYMLPETGGAGNIGYIGGGTALVFLSLLSLYIVKHTHRKEV